MTGFELTHPPYATLFDTSSIPKNPATLKRSFTTVAAAFMDPARSWHIPKFACFHLPLKHCAVGSVGGISPTNINIIKQIKLPTARIHQPGLCDHHQGLGRIVETSCLIPARPLYGIQVSRFAFLVAKGACDLGALTSAWETQLAEFLYGDMM